MSTVRKSAQCYCGAFTSINGRRINYKYIIATIVSCVLSQFSGHTIEPEDFDTTHETISSCNVVYSSAIY